MWRWGGLCQNDDVKSRAVPVDIRKADAFVEHVSTQEVMLAVMHKDGLLLRLAHDDLKDYLSRTHLPEIG